MTAKERAIGVVELVFGSGEQNQRICWVKEIEKGVASHAAEATAPLEARVRELEGALSKIRTIVLVELRVANGRYDGSDDDWDTVREIAGVALGCIPVNAARENRA